MPTGSSRCTGWWDCLDSIDQAIIIGPSALGACIVLAAIIMRTKR